MSAPGWRHQRIYRRLLWLYPVDYRATYGQQMVQLFGDQIRKDGSIRTWLRASGDLVTSAASEHMRRNRTVAQSLSIAPTPIGRVLGILGVIGGVVLLAAFLPFAWGGPDLFVLRLALFALGAIAVVVAVHTRQRDAGRWLALAGVIPAIIANAVYLVLILRLVSLPGEIGPGDYGPIHAYAQGAMWLSDLWFGLVALRLGSVSRISAAALVVGSLGTVLGMSNLGLAPPGSLMEKVALSGIAILGLAWILLGLEVALRRSSSPIRAR